MAMNVKLRETEKRLIENDISKPVPISISSSCPNCLKLSKMHEIEIQKKIREIESLKKDVESLMAFFDLGE